MRKPEQRRPFRWWHPLLFLLVIPLLPVLVLVAVLGLTAYLLSTAGVYLSAWLWWGLRGRSILFVYSDSPIWHDYLEEHVVPHLDRRAVILNWSQRKKWRLSLAKVLFYHFSTWRAYKHPLAVVVRPFRRARVFRFWQPFRDFKHGHPEALQRLEHEFFDFIAVQPQRRLQ